MFTPLPYFDPFLIANPTLPKLYWEVKSPEQLTANLYCIINALKDYVNDASEQVNENSAAIDRLEMLFEKFMLSGFMITTLSKLKSGLTITSNGFGRRSGR